MSESNDFDPGPWRGHDFGAAYARYDAHVGRSYDDACAKSKPRKDLLAASIKTKCTNPLVIWADVTGSMDDWPKVMFSKLPYLELEAKEYLGDDLEIAFGAIGDANTDKYPLQMRPFTSGTELKDRMEELVIEANGGGQIQETYELGALYGVHKIAMPNAVKPIMIFIGDEKPYQVISPEMAQDVVGVKLERRVSTKEVFEQLKQRFCVYVITKPYGKSSGNVVSEETRDVRRAWLDLVGQDHVCELPSAERVVDVIFGILAKETGRIDYFREEIEGRQRPDQVVTVYKSLATVHQLPGRRTGGTGHSILKLEAHGGESKPLLE